MTLKKSNLIVALALLVLTLIYFYPVLFGGKVLLLRDMHTFFHGMKFFYRESVLSGEFPFWCPYTQCGTPMFANLQTAFLYPFSIIYIIFPTTYSMAAYTAFHMWMFAWFMYLLARECGLKVPAAFLAACAAFLGSMPLQLAECPELMTGFVWIPLVLYLLLGFLRTYSWSKAIWLGVSGAMLFYAGSPYPLLMVLIAMLAVGAPYVITNKTRLSKCVGPLLFAAVLAALLSAPQLLSTLELTGQLPKEVLLQAGRDRDSNSLLLIDWATMIFPYLYGFPKPTLSIYLGVLVVALLFTGIFVAFALKRITRQNVILSSGIREPRIVPSMISLFVTGVVMACGSYWYIDKILEIFPLIIRCYSYPCQYSFMSMIAMPVIGGIIFQKIIEMRADLNFRRIVSYGLLAGAAIGVVAAVAYPAICSWIEHRRMVSSIAQGLISSSAAPSFFPPGKGVWLFVGFWFGSLGLLAIAILTRIKAGWMALLFATLLLVDKAVYMGDLRMFNEHNAYEMESNTIKYLKSVNADKELVRVHMTNTMLGFTHITWGSNDYKDYMLVRDWMPEQIGVPYHFFLTYGGAVMRIPESEYLLRPLMDRLRPEQNDKLRGIWNAKYILEFKFEDNRLSYGLRQNPQVLPRAWVSKRAKSVNSWDECINTILSPTYDPRNTALIFAPETDIPDNVLNQTEGNMAVDSIKYTANTITIKAKAEFDGILAISDAYYKGWRAYVDGKETKIFKANLAGKAVYLPAGEHVVRFVYLPTYFSTGCVLFFVGVMGVIVVVARCRRKRKLLSNDS